MPASRTICFVSGIFFALILYASSASAVLAQENSPSIKFNLFSVEGLVTGKTIAVNAAFGEKYSVPVPAPFSFMVPDQDGVTPLYNTPTAPSGMLFKVSFATEDRQLIENIQFVVMTLPMREQRARLINLAGLLANKVYSSAVSSYAESKYLGTRETKVGKYEAIEVVGKYMDPKLGLMYVRIVGIPNPDSAESVFSVANIVAGRVEIENLDDLARTLSGTALRFFKYRDK